MNRTSVFLPLLAAAVLTATGLGVGFFGDDAYHLLIIEGDRTPATDGSLYTFAMGDPAIMQPFIETGPYPWWTLPELKIVFFRPLSNVIHRIDHAMFGRYAVFWHLHAMLWYLAMVLLWTLVARKTLSAPVAVLSAFLFAIDECHWMPAVWLANRNALIACVPALFGLYAHIRWREDRWRPGLPLSIAGYAVGMLGGEAWLGMASYVAAYELFGRNDAIARRAASLAPAALSAITYAAAYKLLGFGVSGSGVYTEPFSALYLAEAPGRAIALLGGLLVASPVDAWGLVPEWRWALTVSGLAGVVLFGMLLRWCWPAIDESDRRALRWLVPGGLISLLPVIAAFPMSRLLLGPSIAASATVAVLIRHWWITRKSGRVRLAGVACAMIAVLNLVLAPLGWPIQSGILMAVGRKMERAYANAPIDDARAAQQDIYLLASFDPLSLLYPPILRRLNGSPLPGSWHALSASPSNHVFTRTTQKAFEFEPAKGALMHGAIAEILRGPESPIAVGDTVRLRNARVTVLDVIDGNPRKIRVECDRPLDDPSLLFLEWKDYSLKTFAVPPVGESRDVRYFSE